MCLFCAWTISVHLSTKREISDRVRNIFHSTVWTVLVNRATSRHKPHGGVPLFGMYSKNRVQKETAGTSPDTLSDFLSTKTALTSHVSAYCRKNGITRDTLLGPSSVAIMENIPNWLVSDLEHFRRRQQHFKYLCFQGWLTQPITVYAAGHFQTTT